MSFCTLLLLREMDRLGRIPPRLVAKPYLLTPSEQPYVNEDNYIDFSRATSPDTRHWHIITGVAVLLAVHIALASSSQSGYLVGIAQLFHASEKAAGLVIITFLLSYCAGPLLFAPFSEFNGWRRVVSPRVLKLALALSQRTSHSDVEGAGPALKKQNLPYKSLCL
jgi:hypothetical protein